MCSECYGHRPNYCLYSHRDECKDLCIRIFTVLSFFAVVFPVAQTVKRLPATQETWVQSLGQEDPLEKGMAIHSSILFFFFPVFLPGEFHGERSLVGYSPWDRKQWDRTERLTLHYLFPQWPQTG